jgi:hypothetical protein
MSVPIARVGKILAGDEAGWFVKVLDDSGNTGGFTILTSSVSTFETGFDGWVADHDDLVRYFIEAGWKIEWS